MDIVCCCGKSIEWAGKGRKPRYCSEAHRQKAKRVRNHAKTVKQMREQRSKLYIAPCDLDTANSFVSFMHRHNKAVPGAKFNLAILDSTGLLRGVAIIGRPVARNIDDGLTLEVSRVCTDGCPNACSALYGAARKVCFDLGYQRLITYTLVDESGASMRGAGWEKVAEVQASTNWHSRTGRAHQQIENVNKWRWQTVNPEFKDKRRPTTIVLPEAIRSKSHGGQMSLFEEIV